MKDPLYLLTGMAIIGLTIVLSMMFYAMSVPSAPKPPLTVADEIQACVESSFNHNSMSTNEQKDIIKTCTDSVIAANASPNRLASDQVK